MNQASLLILGLITLTWGNAAMAQDVSSFNSTASANSSYTPAIPQSDPNVVAQSTVAQSTAAQSIDKLSIPPAGNSSYSQAKAATSVPAKVVPVQSAAEVSPFQLPPSLTDADLFEPGSASAPESATAPGSDLQPPANPDASDSTSPDPGIQFEQTPDAEIAPPTIATAPASIIANAAPVSPPAEKSIGLDFSLPPANISPANISSSATVVAASPLPVQPAPVQPVPDNAGSIASAPLDTLFAGDSNSLVAKAVGSAEGTRTPDGGKNPSYYGHTDPGNGVWNLGSFSYQHGASSPEEADAKQLARLRTQAESMLGKAETQGVDLTLEEKLNGIDLANQAPKAVLDSQGYVDWLAEARRQGKKGSDAILWARVQSFIDPYTQSWNAPGLGNTEDQITHDQERRMLAIARALATYLQDLANNSSQSTKEPVSQRSLTEEQGIARLFTQPMTRLFEWMGTLPPEQHDPEAIGIQQLFSLDRS